MHKSLHAKSKATVKVVSAYCSETQAGKGLRRQTRSPLLYCQQPSTIILQKAFACHDHSCGMVSRAIYTQESHNIAIFDSSLQPQGKNCRTTSNEWRAPWHKPKSGVRKTTKRASPTELAQMSDLLRHAVIGHTWSQHWPSQPNPNSSKVTLSRSANITINSVAKD